MGNYLKYGIIVVSAVGIIGMAAMFGKVGVRPRALAVIKPSTFDEASEVGFWAARQTRQKIFRNQLVFLGFDPESTESMEVVAGFLQSSQEAGPAYDVVISVQKMDLKGVENIEVSADSSAEEILSRARPYLLNKKRVAVVLPTSRTSKLLKASFSRTFEYELGQKLAAFSVLKQKQDDLTSVREADYCAGAQKMSFEKAEMLRCLFLIHENKFLKELEKSPKPVAAAVDQYGLDDYFVYLYSR